MSTVSADRPNTDIVNLEISQEGSAETNPYFKLPFLLRDRKYTCAVTSLTVPLMNTRMLPDTLGGLMYIRRRNVEQDIGNAAHTDLDGRGLVAGQVLDALAAAIPPAAAQPEPGSTLAVMARNAEIELDPSVLTTQGIPMLNIADFLVKLKSFEDTFTKKMRAVGMDPKFYGAPAGGATGVYDAGFLRGDVPAPLAPPAVPPTFFSFGVTPSGHLFITLEPTFSNHFYMIVSRLGQELLGIPHGILAPTMNQITGVTTYFGEGLTDGANIIQPATVSVAVPYYGHRSLLQTLETRISVHVTSNLDVMRTIKIQNQVEGSSFDLASYAIRNDSTAQLLVSGVSVQNDMRFISETHCGQAVLQARSDPPTQWNTLLHHDITSMKLRLYLRVREWNVLTETWSVTDKEFPFEHKTDRWTLGLRFVSLQ